MAYNALRDLGEYVRVDDVEGFDDLPSNVQRSYWTLVVWFHEVSIDEGQHGRSIYVGFFVVDHVRVWSMALALQVVGFVHGALDLQGQLLEWIED